VITTLITRLTFALLLTLSGSASAGVLDHLKQTPATRYDIGLLQLEIAFSRLTNEIKDASKGKLRSFDGFSIDEENSKIYITQHIKRPAKDIIPEECQNYKSTIGGKINISKITEAVWPGLESAQYDKLNDEILFRTRLISKENQSFTFDC